MPSHLLKPFGAAAVVIALIAGGSELQGAVRLQPCAGTEYTASVESKANGPGPDRLTIVLVGDTGFNDAPVSPEGLRKDGKVLSFKDSLSGIASEVNGDLAFLNLETVVTDRNDLVADQKGQKSPYNFKSHPLGLKSLIDTGFNLFSLANNHSMDYGATGAEETLYHMAVAAAEGAIAYAGIGSNMEEATRPGCLELGDTKIAFGAAGIHHWTARGASRRQGEARTGVVSQPR
jgi:hypothetical protein